MLFPKILRSCSLFNLSKISPVTGTTYFGRHKSSTKLNIHVPKSYRSHPGTKLTSSYIHAASEIPYLATTLADLLDYRAEESCDSVGYVACHQNIRKTYPQLKDDAEKLATGLLKLGLQPGDRIGIWSPNSYEWIVTMFAASKAGLILVNVNPAYKVHELEYCINKVQMKAIVAAEGVGPLKYYDYFKQLIPDLSTHNIKSQRIPDLKNIIMVTKQPDNFPGTYSFSEICELGTKEEYLQLEKIADKLQPDDAFNIQFTSGTTGSPKGATLSYLGLINAAYYIGLRLGAGLDTNSFTCPLPLYHVFGCVGNLVLSTIFGGKLVLPSARFDAEATLKAIHDERTQLIAGVPTMWKDMLNHPNLNKYDLSCLKLGVMGGAPCPPETVREARAKMGISNVTCGYGSTEQSLCTFFGFPDDPAHIFTVTTGYPLDHVEAKVVDSEGRIVPLGEKGELWTRGFGTMIGYWDDEQKTKEAIRNDRWMLSGDLATIDESGYLKIVGRLKDMIIRGGENIYPVEIENTLLESPLVADAHICGIPDERLGEEVVAWIKLRQPQNDPPEVTSDKLKTFLSEKLAKYKVPKYYLFYNSAEEIPTTVTAKVQKFKLAEKSMERLGLSKSS